MTNKIGELLWFVFQAEILGKYILQFTFLFDFFFHLFFLPHGSVSPFLFIFSTFVLIQVCRDGIS